MRIALHGEGALDDAREWLDRLDRFPARIEEDPELAAELADRLGEMRAAAEECRKALEGYEGQAQCPA